MAVTTTCPACNQRLQVPEQHVGKNVRCPKCQKVFLVGDAAKPAPILTNPPKPPAAAVPSTPPAPPQAVRPGKAPAPKARAAAEQTPARPSSKFMTTPVLIIGVGCLAMLIVLGGMIAAVAWFLVPSSATQPSVVQVQQVAVPPVANDKDVVPLAKAPAQPSKDSPPKTAPVQAKAVDNKPKAADIPAAAPPPRPSIHRRQTKASQPLPNPLPPFWKRIPSWVLPTSTIQCGRPFAKTTRST